MTEVRDIGIDVRAPPRAPEPGDKLNPFNGSLPVRGATIVGRVVEHTMQGTVVVEKQHSRFVPKYERYEKRTSRYPAHLPSNVDAGIGDEVTIAECRPISKTVRFVVVENRTEDAVTPKLSHREAPAKSVHEEATAKAAEADEGDETEADEEEQ